MMQKISIPTLFIMLAVPFVLVTGVLMTKSSQPVGVPSCYKELVCDTLQILDTAKIKQLQDYHQNLLTQYDIDLRVLTGTMTAAETINFFKAAKIGQKSKTHNGALLMIDPQSALVRFQATSGLHDIYTNEFVSYIEEQQMASFFKAGKVSQGIIATTEIIAARAQDAAFGKAFSALDYSAAVNRSVADNVVASKASTEPDIKRPAEIVSDYQRMMVMGDTSYNSQIYSKASKVFRMNSPTTDIAMKDELRTHQACNIYKEVILPTGLAALLYEVDQRQCSPYLLVFENGGWRIDLPSMAKYIRFNNSKEWYMDVTSSSLYKDAFLDWTFDQSGIPHSLPPMRWGLLVESDFTARVTYIKKIYDHSPASKMPIKEQDVILKWGDIANPTHIDIEKSMETTPGGQKINVLLWRNGQKLTVNIEAPPLLTR